MRRGPDTKPAINRRIVRAGILIRRSVDRWIAPYSLVGNQPVHGRDAFPWLGALERCAGTIRQEAVAVLRHRQHIPALSELSPDHRRLTSDGKWQSFFLWGYGYRSARNCRQCPETARIVETIPGLKTAMFSIHAPGVHVPAHLGVTKAMLTCHLGLIVPRARERCRMRAAQNCVWEEGRAFVFDDTYEHEIWNDTNQDRVILLIQFARPLRFPGPLIAGSFLSAIRWSPFIQEPLRTMRRREIAFSDAVVRSQTAAASEGKEKRDRRGLSTRPPPSAAPLPSGTSTPCDSRPTSPAAARNHTARSSPVAASRRARSRPGARS
jgi:hypothetical protein